MEKLEKLVEFVRYQKYSIEEYKKRYARGDREDCNRMLEEVANILEQEEENKKYKQIVEEIKEKFLSHDNFCHYAWGILACEIIDNIKQKYFPPVKKTVTIKFETEDEDVVNCCIRIIKKRLEEYSDSVHIDCKVEED